MIAFEVGGRTGAGYLALPESGQGPGLLVLHAWWGLTSCFTEVCDRLAREGFVALAPDLYFGKTAATIDEAQALIEQRDFEQMKTTATGALAYLHNHPAVRGGALGALGFSMGGAWAVFLSTLAPAEIAAVVIFYGSESVDFAAARAAYLGHYAEDDEWEPDEEVRQMEAAMCTAGREVALYTYPGVKHWFFEANRPEYDRDAAELAWQRTCAFLHERLANRADQKEQHMDTPIDFPLAPKDKAELLERIRRGHAPLEQTLGRLSEAEMTASLEGGWSVKDNLAHITAWQAVLRLFHIGGRPFREAAPSIAADYLTDDVDTINDAFYRRDRDRPLHEVLDAFRRSHEQTLALIEGMSEAELFRSYTPPGRDASSAGQLVAWIAGDTYEHYMEHHATIRSLTERAAGTA